MKALNATCICLLLSLSCQGQYTLDTSKIFDVLSKAGSVPTQLHADPDVARTIEAIDENLPNLITNLFHFKALRHVVIEAPNISVKTLISKELTLTMILHDATPFHFQDLWTDLKHDTTKFLSDELVAREYKLLYPGFRHAKPTSMVDPLAIKSSLVLKNMVFYFSSIDQTVDSINKKLSRSDSKALYRYLSNNFDFYDVDRRQVKPKTIRIANIVLGDTDLIFSSIDLYGANFLLTFSKAQNWKLINTLRLSEN